MTRVHLGILALSAALLPMSKTADAAIAFTTDRSGLRSLTLNGFETIGDPGYQGRVLPLWLRCDTAPRRRHQLRWRRPACDQQRPPRPASSTRRGRGARSM